MVESVVLVSHWQEASITEKSAGSLWTRGHKKVGAHDSNLSGCHRWRNLPEGTPIGDAWVLCCAKDLSVCCRLTWLQELKIPGSSHSRSAPSILLKSRACEYRWWGQECRVEPVTIPRAIKTWKPNHHTIQSHPLTQKVSTTLSSRATCPPVANYDPNIRHPAVDQNYLPAIHQWWVETKRMENKAMKAIYIAYKQLGCRLQKQKFRINVWKQHSQRMLWGYFCILTCPRLFYDPIPGGLLRWC